MAQPSTEDFTAAVRLRPHRGPCTQPNFDGCICGADADRALIAQALCDEREKTEARVHREVVQRGTRSVPVSTDGLLEVLAGMSNAVRAQDSFGGWIEYDALGGEPCPLCQGLGMEDCEGCHGTGERQLPEGTDFWVRGLFRIGNTEGQGGVRIIGVVQGG